MAETNEAAQSAGAETTTSEESLLDKVLKESKWKPDQREHGKTIVQAVIDDALQGTVSFDKNVGKTVQNRIDDIDRAISSQLSEIMHNDVFQKLEGSWRGLKHLVMNSRTGDLLKLRVLNAKKKEVFQDLDRATEFDQSQMFKKLYENEFGMPGGEPFGALIGDFEFTKHPQDIALLEKMSNVAAASFCPFISAAAPDLFSFDDWTELSKPRDLAKIFSTPEYTKWKSFRSSPDSRFVGLVMPRVLSRLPYGASTCPVEEFKYEEVDLHATGHAKVTPHEQYTWMNAAYVMGVRLTDAFSQHGFCVAIRGRNGGGAVEGLPTHVFLSDDGDLDTKCPTEIGITDRREKELSDLGFLPLSHYKNTDYAVFFGGQTTQKPDFYPENPDATANAEISARLPYMMATSRFAHYLKVIARDKIGDFMEREDCEKWLNGWINNYVLKDPAGTSTQKAKYPLAAAKVKVEEIPGKPGSYNAIAWLRPWLQLEELTTSMRLVAKLPEGV